MKINFGTVLTTLEGEPMKEGFGEVKDVITDYPCPKCGNVLKVVMKDRGIRDLTLGSVCVEALMKPHEKDKAMTGQQKMDRFILAGRISESRKAKAPKSETIEITADEAKVLKDVISEESIAIVGRAYPILDGK